MTQAIDPARLRNDWLDDPPDAPGAPPEVDRLESDAAARERYESFVAAGTGRPPRTIACAPAPSGPEESVAGATLFVQGPGEAHAIAMTDVEQSGLGDCFLLATAAAAATRPEGRTLLRNLITENRNDKGEVVSYSVTLHAPETTLFGLRTTWVERKVEVAPGYVPGHAIAHEFAGKSEVWSPVLEKAFIKVFGYAPASCGAQVALAMAALTGKEPKEHGIGGIFDSYGPSDLLGDLSAGKTLVLSTRGDLVHPPAPVPPSHALVVLGTEEKGGTVLVRLYNPWRRINVVPLADLEKYFVKASALPLP
jgi:hypothetical protein